MGGGGWYIWNKKDTVEDHHGLDVRYLYRQGILTFGFHSISWSCGERKTGSIGYWGGDDSITLDYRHRKAGSDDWEDVKQTVSLSWTHCNYGGRRPWFICGNCGRRVAVIYGVGKYFACRHCYDLTYRSCQESDSRYCRFLRNYANLGLNFDRENMPMWAAMGLLKRMWKEEEQFEKQMKKRHRGRPRKQKKRK
jgi:hypothetical protein